MGFRIVGRGEGTAEVEADLREEFRNPGRVAHGGVLASLLDSALAAAVITTLRPGERCATIHLDLHYLRTAVKGPLRAAARVTKRAAALAFVEGEVRGPDRRLLLQGQGIWFVGKRIRGTRPLGTPRRASRSRRSRRTPPGPSHPA